MNAEDEAKGNMRACGCHMGRPCVCGMSGESRPWLAPGAVQFECGGCINCRLNRRLGRGRRSTDRRRCLQYDAHIAALEYDTVTLRGNYVFRMRKPTESIVNKSAFFARMHQMRIAMEETAAASTAIIEAQSGERRKLNRDLVKAQEMLRTLEEKRKSTPSMLLTGAKGLARVDSDVFDSFSKQLIPAETLLPDVRRRLEIVNATILQEETSIKVIREYVCDFAARKLQGSLREYLRHRRWKAIWRNFKLDAQLAAVITVQAACRMLLAKQRARFLRQLKEDRARARAASILRRFLDRFRPRRPCATESAHLQALEEAAGRRAKAVEALFRSLSRTLCRIYLWHWREVKRSTAAHEVKRKASSALLIQKVFRGYRTSVQMHRRRCLQSLTSRVHELVSSFIATGNFWGFILEIDADYRRFMAKMDEENADAATFASTVLKMRQREEDRTLQNWLTISALESPIVRQCGQLADTYSNGGSKMAPPSIGSAVLDNSLGHPRGTSILSELICSPMAEDLVALSSNKRRSDIFPDEMPAHVIRQAMAAGFELDDIITVMRGLQAQRKDINSASIVVRELRRRTPLMRNPWKSERALRCEAAGGSPSKLSPKSSLPDKLASPDRSKRQSSTIKSGSTSSKFITRNLLESIPGGMSGSIQRLLLVAGLKVFDPLANAGEGDFVFPEDFSSDPFQDYLAAASPLVKVRREQQVAKAIEPSLQILVEKRCLSAYDILSGVRGIQELVAWGIPETLARSLYHVIEELYEQSNRVSARNLKREVRVSVQFEEFFEERRREAISAQHQAALTTGKAGKIGVNLGEPDRKTKSPVRRAAAALNDQSESYIEVKQRLERDVLQLPIDSDSFDASDVIFKAAFLTCSCTTTFLPDVPDSETYDGFLRTLVELQASGKSNDMKAIVRERVVVAKAIANRYVRRCEELHILSAGDLAAKDNLERLRLDEPLKEQLSRMLEALRRKKRAQSGRGSRRSPAATPAHLTPLIPLIQQANCQLLDSGTKDAPSNATLSQ